DGGAARFAVSTDAQAAQPAYLAEAAAFVQRLERRGNGMSFDAGGYYKPFVRLANAGACSIQVDGRPARAAHAQDNTVRVELSGVAAQSVTYQRVDVVC
ncbi:hypothetical protein ACQCRK_26345, partial [Ralstonia pseudosolanacearum]